MKEFITLLCKGERVYFDEHNNTFGCAYWMCRGFNQIPFSCVGKVYQLKTENIIKEYDFREAGYKHTDNIGAIYFYNDEEITVSPKFIKLFDKCKFSIEKDFLTCWFNGYLVGIIMGVKRPKG